MCDCVLVSTFWGEEGEYEMIPPKKYGLVTWFGVGRVENGIVLDVCCYVWCVCTVKKSKREKYMVWVSADDGEGVVCFSDVISVMCSMYYTLNRAQYVEWNFIWCGMAC